MPNEPSNGTKPERPIPRQRYLGPRTPPAKMHKDFRPPVRHRRTHQRYQSRTLAPARHRMYDPCPRSAQPSPHGPRRPLSNGTAAPRWNWTHKAPATSRPRKRSVDGWPTYATIADSQGTPAGTAPQHRRHGGPPLLRFTQTPPRRREKTTPKSDPGALFRRTSPAPHNAYNAAGSQEQCNDYRPGSTRV